MAEGMTSTSSTQRSFRHPSIYQFATSPDIIRSNQKDTYEILSLSTSLTDLLRRLYGSRFTHKYATGIETLAQLLYFSLTTLIGNRTLGEEYTDLYQVEISRREKDFQRLPTIRRRASYILLSLLFPYALSKALPALREWMKNLLARGLEAKSEAQTKTLRVLRYLQRYLLTHISELMSPGPIYALTLTLFYFSGSYYNLSKRLLGMRYVFSKRLSQREEDSRVGYEVLGLLLVLQIVVQACVHLKSTLQDSGTVHSDDENGEVTEQNRMNGNSSRTATTANTSLPTPKAGSLEVVRYDLEDPSTMAWVQPKPQRNCTLCLEQMKDPSVATCGHLFCWTCLMDWVEEKPECPLCRQGILRQHILPLRG